jgi:hypothetical protein
MEPKYVWSWGNNFKPDDVLTEKDATQKIISHIQKRFDKFLRQSGKERLLEKTPNNCLRLPFIRAVFPEAKIIHIVRDGRSVFYSTGEILNQGYFKQNVLQNRLLEMLVETPYWAWSAYIPRAIETLLRKIEGRPLNFWGPRPPGWRDWVETDSQNIIIAKQWSATVSQAVREGNTIDKQFYFRFRYEDLMANPINLIQNIIDFSELQDAEQVVKYVKQTVDPTRQHKWHELIDTNTLEQIRPYMEDVLYQLGYEW